jgi:hypothetical protein
MDDLRMQPDWVEWLSSLVTGSRNGGEGILGEVHGRSPGPFEDYNNWEVAVEELQNLQGMS